jgi:hypothetical protein
MRKLAALSGALLLTLALAAPAAADQKVHVAQWSGPYEFEGPVEWIGFECTGPLFFGFYGRGDLWLWYPNDLAEDEMFPEDRAWPWVKGLIKDRGTFYFSSEEDMGGTVLSGDFAYQTHQYDHHLGNPSDLANDPETWIAMQTGTDLNIKAPGYGTVVHSSGNVVYKMLVTEYNEYPEQDVFGDEGLRPFRGNQTYDAEELCAFFGYEVAP